jgi:uncharacterized protein
VELSRRVATLELKVAPKASRNAITGWLGAALKVAVTAAPERGKANEAVETLLAQALGLPRSAVTVVAGHGARAKRVEVAGLAEAELAARLRTIVGHASGAAR